MALLLGIDLETTGLNPDTDKIIEIGGVFWDTQQNTMTECFSFLVNSLEPEEKLTPDIEILTGIHTTLLKKHGAFHSVGHLVAFIGKADYLVAHNAGFEKSFLKQTSLVEGLQTLGFFVDSIPWIDTKTDIPYLPGKGQGTLSEIAMAHGVFNPMPHRALTDALAMMQILAKYDINQVIENAKAPTLNLVANVSYDDRDKAKALGYYWDGKKRIWSKPIKAFRLDDEMNAAKEMSMSTYVLEEKA